MLFPFREKNLNGNIQKIQQMLVLESNFNETNLKGDKEEEKEDKSLTNHEQVCGRDQQQMPSYNELKIDLYEAKHESVKWKRKYYDERIDKQKYHQLKVEKKQWKKQEKAGKEQDKFRKIQMEYLIKLEGKRKKQISSLKQIVEDRERERDDLDDLLATKLNLNLRIFELIQRNDPYEALQVIKEYLRMNLEDEGKWWMWLLQSYVLPMAANKVINRVEARLRLIMDGCIEDNDGFWSVFKQAKEIGVLGLNDDMERKIQDLKDWRNKQMHQNKEEFLSKQKLEHMAALITEIGENFTF